MDVSAILYEQLQMPILRQETFCQGLNVTLGTVATAGSIRITLHDD
jgi:hypothetical protein